MPGLEDVAGVPEINLVAVHLPRPDERRLLQRFAVAGAAQALAEDDGLAVRVDIHERGREVRIGRAGRGVEGELYRPGHLDRRGERC